MIDHARNLRRPIVFVTDDVKEDWYWRYEGKTIGPRPELIAEMADKAGVFFYCYKTDQFMSYAKKYLHTVTADKAIEEVKQIRQHDDAIDLPDDDEPIDVSYENIAELFKAFEAYRASKVRETISPPFNVGDKVRHAVFGDGRVVACEGVGDDAKVTVAFPNLGVKRLVAGFAKLQKITG
jgi:hypothetical protein